MLVLTYSHALAEDTRWVQTLPDQLHGPRTARIKDPAASQWTIHTVLTNLSSGEIRRRAAQLIGQKSN